jgi:hypothetical protein
MDLAGASGSDLGPRQETVQRPWRSCVGTTLWGNARANTAAQTLRNEARTLADNSRRLGGLVT